MENAASNEGNVIAATRRPNGTWRKERRVKPGYVPPDEAEKYESKGRLIARGLDVIPGLSQEVAEKPKLSKNQKKNARRKNKSSETASHSNTLEQGVSTLTISNDEDTVTKSNTDNATTNTESVAADVVKKLRNLKKKLRQIEQLEERVNNGEPLEKEQLEKISRKQEVLDEIADLE